MQDLEEDVTSVRMVVYGCARGKDFKALLNQTVDIGTGAYDLNRVSTSSSSSRNGRTRVKVLGLGKEADCAPHHWTLGVARGALYPVSLRVSAYWNLKSDNLLTVWKHLKRREK